MAQFIVQITWIYSRNIQTKESLGFQILYLNYAPRLCSKLTSQLSDFGISFINLLSNFSIRINICFLFFVCLRHVFRYQSYCLFNICIFVSQFKLLYRIFFQLRVIQLIMKNLCIILLLSSVLFSYGLHVNYHQSPESYLASLKSKHTGISSQLLSLKNDVSQVQQQINSQTDTAKKIKLLEEAIIRQKAQLSSLSRSLIIPLNESSWTCSNFVSTSKSQIQNLASSIVTSTSSLDQTINKISNQSSSPYFSQQSSAASLLAKDLEKSVYSTGSLTGSLSTGKQTNWLANNWISGSMTGAQVEQQTKTNDQSIGYITTCPLETPFYDGTSCISCPDKQYFNWETKKCVICSNFVVATHKCNDAPPQPPQVKPTISNFNSSINLMILDPNINPQLLKNMTGEPCPSLTPFLTANGCISCQAPNVLFDYSAQRCTTCPAGQTFIQEKHSCIIVTKSIRVTNLPVGQNRMILPEGVTIDSLQVQQQELSKNATLDVCPSDKPFYNNADCINCQADQYFSTEKLACLSCSSGERYDEKSHRCVKTVYYTNLLNRNWTSTNPDSIRSQVKTASSTPGALACPIDKPFFDGNACQGCPINQQYNFDGLKCEVCGAGTVFSSNLHSCVVYQPNAYQTNPETAPNLIYDGTSISQYMQEYRNNIEQHPHIIDCSAKDPNRPYYDGVSCISCPKQFSLFNLKQKVCQVCNEGSYDSKEHECISSSDQIISQKPNIQKILASIFT